MSWPPRTERRQSARSSTDASAEVRRCLRIPLSLVGRDGVERPVLTRTGRRAVYVTDIVAWFTDGSVEVREMKAKRRSGPEYERWWMKLQVLRAMGLDVVIVGNDGQPAEDVA